MRVIISLCAALCVGLPAYAAEPALEEGEMMLCNTALQVAEFFDLVEAGLDVDIALQEINKSHGKSSCDEDLVIFEYVEKAQDNYYDWLEMRIEIWRVRIRAYVEVAGDVRKVTWLEHEPLYQYVWIESDLAPPPPPEELYDPLEPPPDEEDA